MYLHDFIRVDITDLQGRMSNYKTNVILQTLIMFFMFNFIGKQFLLSRNLTTYYISPSFTVHSLKAFLLQTCYP